VPAAELQSPERVITSAQLTTGVSTTNHPLLLQKTMQLSETAGKCCASEAPCAALVEISSVHEVTFLPFAFLLVECHFCCNRNCLGLESINAAHKAQPVSRMISQPHEISPLVHQPINHH